MSYNHRPKGPNGTWTTGQRVPTTGFYQDQHGTVTHHEAGRTFPPCLDRKGESAHRFLTRPAAATA